MEINWSLNLDLHLKDQNLQDMEIGRSKVNALIFEMNEFCKIDMINSAGSLR